MDEAPSTPHPYGPDAPTADHVGLAFTTLGFAVSIGTGISALSGLVVRTLQLGAPPATQVELSSAPAVVLLGGTFFALLVAAAITWRLLAPTRSPYRQGMLAMVAAFATLLVGLITLPIDRAFGRPGLGTLALAAFVVAALLGRRLSRV